MTIKSRKMCGTCYEKQWFAENPERYAKKLEYQNRYKSERLRNDPEYAGRTREKDRVRSAQERGDANVGTPRRSMKDVACAICGTVPCLANNLCDRCYMREYARKRRREGRNLPERERARIVSQRNYAIIRKLKAAPCTDCGRTFPNCAMEFDHVRGEKLFNLNNAGTRTVESVMAEIAKCDLVCACCHHIRTCNRRTDRERCRLSH